ncbi:hypothetical protein [Streptomyces sp. NPDC059639]
MTLFSLLSHQSVPRADGDRGRSVALWHRRERARFYQAPHSWR